MAPSGRMENEVRRILLKVRFLGLIAIAVVGGAWPVAAQAAAVPGLGSAAGFAVLSAAPNGLGAVTCTGGAITGKVGSSGARASVVQTGCPITGAIVAPVSSQVVTDFNTAYAGYAAISCSGQPLTGTLAGISLTSGVYCFTAAATLTGTLTLTGSGPWIFKIGTGGTGALTGTNFTVLTSNPCNVNWWVAQAATMTDSNLKGTILAGAAITLTRGTFHGNALAKAGVTTTGTVVTGCNAAGGPGQGCENEDEDGGQTGQHVGQHADGDSEGCNSEDSHNDGADHKVSDTAKVETHVSGTAISKTEIKSTNTHKSTVATAVKATLTSKPDSENKSQSGNN